MNYKQINAIVEHQVGLLLKEKGLSTRDLSDKEILEYKYHVALLLIQEIE